MRIGIIGSGKIGGAIARGLARAGDELVLSSRRPETLESLAAELGPSARTPQRDGEQHDPQGQSTSHVARAFPAARVVKAFNRIHYRRLERDARPVGDDRLAIPVAGDDPEAKATVAGLVREIGFAPVDTGSLADSRRQEPGSPVYNEPLTAAQAKEALA